jgi:uncharacterized membrane protein (DUF485 family)
MSEDVGTSLADTDTDTKHSDRRRPAEGLVFALLVLGTLLAGYVIPGGGLLVAFVAWVSTPVRESRAQTALLFAIGAILALAVVVPLLSTLFAPVSYVSPGTPAQ